jgi:hypothetical protein
MIPILTLRRNELDRRDRRNFSVLHNHEEIGRIYSDGGSSCEQWFYALNGRDSAYADSFEDAKARLKEEWMSIRSLEEQAERCVELAQQFPNKEAERILRMLAVDLLLKANSKSATSSRRRACESSPPLRAPSRRPSAGTDR